MRGHLLVLLSLCTLSVVAIIALQPDSQVRFEGELSRMPPKQALHTLESPSSYDIGQHNIALVHVQLLMSSGEFEAARRILENLTVALPNNTEVRNRIAHIALLKGEDEVFIRFARARYAAEPTPDGREALGLAYRLQRNAPAEIELLQSVAPEQLTPWEARRLTRLLTATGDAAGAEKLLVRLAKGNSSIAEDAQERLVVMLVDEGRGPDALRETMSWYTAGDFDPSVVERVLPVYLARGANPEAMWFADRVTELATYSIHRLVRIFSRSGHQAAARRYQGVMLSSGRSLRPDEWATLIHFAGLTGDLSGIQSAIASSRNGSISVDLLSEALLQMLRYQGSRALIPYRGKATIELAEESPLIAAAITLDQSQHADTVRHLIEASKTDLKDWDRAIWVSMAKRLHGTGYDRRLLASPNLAKEFKDELAGL